MSKNSWSKIFRTVNKDKISWCFIDSVEFHHPQLSTPMVYSAKMLGNHFTPSTIIDLEQIDKKRVKFVIDQKKLKNHVNLVVQSYLRPKDIIN